MTSRPRNGRAQGGYWYANALRLSQLAPAARHIGHALASVAANDTGRVRLSLTSLTEWTGMSRSTVAKYLNELEGAGFVYRDRPAQWEAVRENKPTEYTTLIPPGFPVTGSPSHGLGGSARDGRGVVRESDKPSPPHGLSTTGTTAARAGSAGAPPGGRRKRTLRRLVDPPPHDYNNPDPDDDDETGPCLDCGFRSTHQTHIVHWFWPGDDGRCTQCGLSTPEHPEHLTDNEDD